MELKIGSTYKKTPYIGTIYGAGGTGKSGIAVYAPNPFFICLEPGTKWIFGNKQLEGVAQTFLNMDGNIVMPSTASFDPEHDEFFAMMRWLCVRKNTEGSGIKTIVIDGMRFLERMFYMDIMRLNPMTKGSNPQKVMDISDLGYDGQLKAMEYWERLFSGAERLRSIGFNVIFITHSLKRNEDKQDGSRYKYIDMELQSYGNANVPNLFQVKCDFVYYIDSQVDTSTSGAGKWQRKVASGNSESIFQIHTRKTPLFYAKSRSIEEGLIPDVYSFTIETRAEVARQIFEDLEKC